MKIYSSKLKPGFYIAGISNIPNDAQEITIKLWRKLLDGQESGYIIDFTVDIPRLIKYTPTKKDKIIEAEAIKSELRFRADTAITPLEDAVALGLATNNEIKMLNDWRKFRVNLNRVNTSDTPCITWPIIPAF